MADALQMAKLFIFLCENSATEIDCDRRIQDLLDRGADVNRRTIGGRTPLMIICWKNKGDNVTGLIEILLRNGADVQITDDFGWNALQFACRYNCTSQLPIIVGKLLEHQIDINSTTRNNWNCMHQLCKYNTGETLYAVIQTLLNNNININAQTNKKDTALHLLCRYCRNADFIAIFNLLIEYGARVDIVAANDKTLLHVLCKYATDLDLHGVMIHLMNTQCKQMVDLLDYYYTTAIVYAARLGCVSTVNYLLLYTKLNIIDIFGQTVTRCIEEIFSSGCFPLCLCCRHKNSVHVSLLLAEISKKMESLARYNSVHRPIDKTALEKAIPRRIDYGFTNTNRDTAIRLPTETGWNTIKEAWTTDSALDLQIFFDFLSQHTHQMCCNIADSCKWCAVTQAVDQYVQELLDAVSTLDHRFEGRNVKYGSSAENSKILQPDEFDFMVVLSNFREVDEQVVQYIGNESANGFQTESDGNISSAKILYYFYMLLADAVNRINQLNIIFQHISFSETCVTLDCIYRGKRSENVPFILSIDITVGVTRSIANANRLSLPPSFRQTEADEDKQYLVPHRQVTGSEISKWKPSFPITERNAFRAFDPVAVRCYCLLKLLVLLVAHVDENNAARKTKPSSYALKTLLFHFVKKKSSPWDESKIDAYCRDICKEYLETRDQLKSFFVNDIPVYEINHESRQVMKKIKDRLKSVQRPSNCFSKWCISC